MEVYYTGKNLSSLSILDTKWFTKSKRLNFEMFWVYFCPYVLFILSVLIWKCNQGELTFSLQASSANPCYKTTQKSYKSIINKYSGLVIMQPSYCQTHKILDLIAYFSQ